MLPISYDKCYDSEIAEFFFEYAIGFYLYNIKWN